MSDPDPIQQERTILRAFREASIRRATNEAEATKEQKSKTEATLAYHRQARERANGLMKDAQNAWESAVTSLSRARLQGMLDPQIEHQPLADDSQADPVVEFQKSVVAVQNASQAINNSVLALIARRSSVLSLSVFVLILLLVCGFVSVGIFIAGIQPCGWVDTMLDYRSGCVRTFKADTGGRIAFSADGKLLASSNGGNTVNLWDVRNGIQVASLTPQSYVSVQSLAFSPDGKLLATGNLDGTVKLWDVTTKKEQRTLTSNSKSVHGVALSSDNKILASWGGEGYITVWDVSAGRQLAFVNLGTLTVYSFALSPDGKMLVAGIADGAIRLWDANNGKESGTLKGHTDAVQSVVFSPNGKFIASGSQDATVKLWDTGNRQQIQSLDEVDKPISYVIFTSDGKSLLAGGADGTVKKWSCTTWGEVATWKVNPALMNRTLAFYTSESFIAVASVDGTVTVWKPK